jgi:hypothetical protein
LGGGLVFVGSGRLPGESTACERAWIAGVPGLAAPEPGVVSLLGVDLIGLAARRMARGRG